MTDSLSFAVHTFASHVLMSVSVDETVYNTKQSDGDVAVMLELWGMRSTPTLSSLSGPLWIRVRASDKILSMNQIELCTYSKLNG